MYHDDLNNTYEIRGEPETGKLVGLVLADDCDGVKEEVKDGQ